MTNGNDDPVGRTPVGEPPSPCIFWRDVARTFSSAAEAYSADLPGIACFTLRAVALPVALCPRCDVLVAQLLDCAEARSLAPVQGLRARCRRLAWALDDDDDDD